MINRELMSKICEKKKGKPLQSIYKNIQKVRETFGNSISKEEAAYIVGSNLGIDIYKYIDNDILFQNRINDIITRYKSLTGSTRTTRIGKTKNINVQQIKVLRVKEIDIEDPILQSRIIDDAKIMAEIFLLIYIFENSIRGFIKKAMDKAYPDGWWNEKRIKNEIYKNANDRRNNEKINLWHGKRSDNMLDYVDLDDLEKILSKNTHVFTPYFKGLPNDLEWLKMKIKEIYPSRCIVAHNNPLSKDDIRRVEVICKDWQRQLPLLKKKLEEK